MGPTLSQPMSFILQASDNDKSKTKRDRSNGEIMSTKTKKAAINTVRRALPLQNAPIVKNALDYLQYETLYKALNPSSYATSVRQSKKVKQQRKLKEEN